MRTVITYEPVKLSARAVFSSCRMCGCPGKRQRIFRQTINPFNRNADGQPKTRNEIWEELLTQAALWKPDVHARCETQ